MAREVISASWQGDLERWLAPFLERLGLGSHDRFHHFVSAGTWDAAPLLEELARKGDGLLGGEVAVLVADDTALPKEGNASVGVAAQYASAFGKHVNCQTMVSLTLVRGEVP